MIKGWPMQQEFDALIDSYIDATIAQSGDMPHSQKEAIRENVRKTLTSFRDKFQNGYDSIGVWLVEHGIECPVLSKEGLKALYTPEMLASGKQVYEVLGFTNDDVQTFYKAAYCLLHQKTGNSYANARNAFFFLVTIAPQVVDFWLGLSHCSTQLKEYDDALDATLHALECNPTLPEIYLQAFFLYLELNQKKEALMLCKQGIDFAKSHTDPWAKTLSTTLEEANARLMMEK